MRANDFQTMLDDTEIKAIFSARGGYGSSRLLDSIDFTTFQKQPKWVIGFSDITAVHCHIHTLDIESLHATMPKLFLQEGGEESVAREHARVERRLAAAARQLAGTAELLPRPLRIQRPGPCH